MSTPKSLMDSLNILAKWRTHFAGWQLGTRSTIDPECQAVRDHREVTILLRAEVSALVGVLIQSGIITREQWYKALEDEARQLNKDYEGKFPGVTAHLNGLTYTPEARSHMAHWKP